MGNSSYYYYAIIDRTYQVSFLNKDIKDDCSWLIENTSWFHHTSHLCMRYCFIQYHTLHFHYWLSSLWHQAWVYQNYKTTPNSANKIERPISSYWTCSYLGWLMICSSVSLKCLTAVLLLCSHVLSFVVVAEAVADVDVFVVTDDIASFGFRWASSFFRFVAGHQMRHISSDSGTAWHAVLGLLGSGSFDFPSSRLLLFLPSLTWANTMSSVSVAAVIWSAAEYSRE